MSISLKIEDLTFTYSIDSKPIFEHLNFELPLNSFNLLIGPSGSGKSTFFKLVAGLYPQYSGIKNNGRILLNGQEIADIVPFERARHVAMLFQNPSRQFAMKTVFEQLVFALENIQYPAHLIEKRATEVLKKSNLWQFKDRVLQTLSGGEQQRVALATVLVLDSSIIFLDEPFANIDSASRLVILDELKQLQLTQHKTIFISDHDISNYDGLVDHLYEIKLSSQTLAELPLTELAKLPAQTKVMQKNLPDNAVFSWHNLSFRVGERPLLSPNSLNIPKGYVGLLSGDNGIGKSTLFAAFSHQKKYSGNILYNGKPSEKIRLRNWARIVANIFQNSSDQFIKLHADEELGFSQSNSLHPEYWTAQRIQDAVNKLDLTHVLKHVNYQLSGGQQKKLQALIILIMSQPIMLFDEPFAGLDLNSLENLLMLIKQTTKDLGLSTLIISHQRRGVVEHIDYELLMDEQTIKRLGEF
ncbi:MAG: ABC transporter ATP-binding protein [Liquorilactobacillus mali]|uniref:ATP-binding cassette domain-containing protein n=1 Tax=Liquorilactobacillus mali TaxID=1618 RepID=UPI0039E9DDBD